MYYGGGAIHVTYEILKRMGKIDIPKPLAKISENETLLDRCVDMFVKNGFSEFIIL